MLNAAKVSGIGTSSDVRNAFVSRLTGLADLGRVPFIL
jgi:hypothetical protein